MTTDEKIDLLISRLIEKAEKFYWSKTDDGWSVVMEPQTGYRITVGRNTIVTITTHFGDTLIPAEDLNPARNQPLRTKLAAMVVKLWNDRSALIDDILEQLKGL